MKHYAIAGRYYGYFADAPERATEVPSRPLIDEANWSGTAWVLPSGGEWIAGFCAQADEAADDALKQLATKFAVLNSLLDQKGQEANELLFSGDANPTAAAYPLLHAMIGQPIKELGGRVPTSISDAAECARLVRLMWRTAGAAIETARQAKKAAIATCTTSEQLQAVLDGSA